MSQFDCHHMKLKQTNKQKQQQQTNKNKIKNKKTQILTWYFSFHFESNKVLSLMQPIFIFNLTQIFYCKSGNL